MGSIKKSVSVVLAILVLAGNVYSQALSPYEKKCMDLNLAFIKQMISVRTKYAAIDGDSEGIAELAKSYRGLAALSDNQSKAKKVSTFMDDLSYGLALLKLGISLGYTEEDRVLALMLEEYGKMFEKLEKDKKAAESLMNSAELKKVRDEKYGNRYFYSSMNSNAQKHFSQKAPQKGEFETTDAFNKRLNAFYDSAAYYLKEYVLKETEFVLKILVEDGRFNLDGYNADKGFYTVNAIISRKDIGDTVKGIMYIPPQEAQELKQKGYSFKISPTDVYLKEYLLYPSKITVTGKADTTKKYIANFTKLNGASDIVFNGIELWKDNPKAKSLVYNYKDLAIEVLARQEEERAEQERIRREREKQEAQERKDRVFDNGAITLANNYFERMGSRNENDFGDIVLVIIDGIRRLLPRMTEFELGNYDENKNVLYVNVKIGNRKIPFISRYDIDKIISYMRKYGISLLSYLVKSDNELLKYMNKLEPSVIRGSISISKEDAEILKRQGYTFYIDPIDICVTLEKSNQNDNYSNRYNDYYSDCECDDDYDGENNDGYVNKIYPTKMTVTSKAANKKYAVEFPKPDGATDLVFKGKYLWKNNPNVKNLEYNYRTLILEQREIERIVREEAEEKQRQKDMDAWAYRIRVAGNRIIFKSDEGNIVFDVGKSMPILKSSYRVQGKTFKFSNTGKDVVCTTIKDDIVISWRLNRKGIIKSSFYNKDILLNGYGGYGIFDVK